jgi:hypothetical protein
MRLSFGLIAMAFLTCSPGLSVSHVQADNTNQNAYQENTGLLKGLSSIQAWAANLEAALREQGNKIDQRKAKDQILPSVIAIQKRLSTFEDINNRIVEDLGTSSDTINREKLEADLIALGSAISDLLTSFEDLRGQVQVISIPEITDVERLGESGVRDRGFQVNKMLKALGYEENHGGETRIDYADLKSSSDKITALLHQAQDAFGKLHTYLQSRPSAQATRH